MTILFECNLDGYLFILNYVTLPSTMTLRRNISRKQKRDGKGRTYMVPKYK